MRQETNHLKYIIRLCLYDDMQMIHVKNTQYFVGCKAVSCIWWHRKAVSHTPDKVLSILIDRSLFMSFMCSIKSVQFFGAPVY